MSLMARLLSSRTHRVPGQLLVAELFFEVPLDYSNPSSKTIQLFARAVTKHERPIIPPPFQKPEDPDLVDFRSAFQRPWMAYLEGGPGVGQREPQHHPLTEHVLGRGYQLLLLDYRGTGLSTPINAEALRKLGPPQAQADYIKHFRADNNVRDCEAVRACLTADWAPERRAWSTFGQSFGGFVTLTYLSMHPEGLRECFMTGGLAPIDSTADDVYTATYRKVAERNEAYFRKFPEDADTLRRIAAHVESSEGGFVPLPAGGKLTMPRLFIMGLAFGGHGGLDSVHAILLRMRTDLDQFGFLTRPTLTAFEQFSPFDVVPFYAFLHEAVYCSKPGVASNWAAERVGKQLERFAWLRDPKAATDKAKYPLYFAGEMIYPFMFDVFPELEALKEAADLLAKFDGWESLYDEQQLARNNVPVYAVSYEDMYVELNLARETAAKVKGIKVFETNVMYHSALRHKTDEVVTQLFRLRDDTID